MSEQADKNAKEIAESLGIPEDVLRAIARLERKRISREYWTPERLADKADELLDRAKEEGE